MKKQLMVFAGLALASGVASAQDLPLPTDALTDGLNNLVDLLELGAGGVGSALIGEHAEDGTDPRSEGAGSGLLGGADLLGDVLRGAGIELQNGSEEGGEYLGNSLQNGIQRLVEGIEAGNETLVETLVNTPELGELLAPLLDNLPGGGGGGEDGGAGPLGPLQGLIDTLLGLLNPDNLPPLPLPI